MTERLPAQEIERCNEFARRFLEHGGRRMVIGPAQWGYFEAAGLDMSLFTLKKPLPLMPTG